MKNNMKSQLTIVFGGRVNRVQCGFSLIEVVLALAILGTGVVLILGMFPASLKAGREASQTAVADIAATDNANEASKFINDSNSDTGTTYFDIGEKAAGNNEFPSPVYADKDGKPMPAPVDATTGAMAVYRIDIEVLCNPNDFNTGGFCSNDVVSNDQVPRGTEVIKVRVSWPVIEPLTTGSIEGLVPCKSASGSDLVYIPNTNPLEGPGCQPKNKHISFIQIARPGFN